MEINYFRFCNRIITFKESNYKNYIQLDLYYNKQVYKIRGYGINIKNIRRAYYDVGISSNNLRKL